MADLTYEFYAEQFGGTLDEAAFVAARGRGLARLRWLTGRMEPPQAHEQAWRLAWCALTERAAHADTRGEIASESVGSTSVTYSAAVQAATDYDAAAPYLALTGLLYQGVGRCPRAL